MAQRSTQRTDPSQPPDYRTYSPEVTSFEQSPGSSQCCMGMAWPFHASLIIIKEIPTNVKRNFSVFYKIMQIFLERRATVQNWFPPLLQRAKKEGPEHPLRPFPGRSLLSLSQAPGQIAGALPRTEPEWLRPGDSAYPGWCR